MRQIKAGKVKPGMTIRWETGGITHECEVEAVTPSLASGAVDLDAVGDGYMRIERATLVTVLSEPAPPQPEEPTAFGARVVAGECKALRGHGRAGGFLPWVVEFPSGNTASYNWKEVCELGPVQVVPDQGWTAPETPEVPERVEEWPEDDTALRPYPWEDIEGCPWRFFGEDDWRFKAHSGYWSYPHPTPADGPWTRKDD